MPTLKLPRALPGPAAPLAPEPPSPPTLLLGRRQFLKGLGVVLAALAAPATGVRRAYAAARGRFFTGHEFATLSALCDRVIPPDRDPGARALGAARYIERMLTAFDHRVPLVFAGGPFSNRNPFPDNDDGTPSRRRPKNAFRHFIPLTRVQEIRWRAELFGSAKVPGADFNDALLGPLAGCFAPPEYGGNHRLRGWTMLDLEGDDQPLGYSIFSRAKDGYNERPDHPMSTPNPDEVSGPRPISAAANSVQDTIIAFTRIFGTD